MALIRIGSRGSDLALWQANFVKDEIEKLGFEVCMDNDEVVSGMRWLTVCPAGNAATQFVLMLVREESDKSRVGTNLMTVLSSTDCI